MFIFQYIQVHAYILFSSNCFGGGALRGAKCQCLSVDPPMLFQTEISHGWVAVKFCTDINSSQTIKPSVFGDALMFNKEVDIKDFLLASLLSHHHQVEISIFSDDWDYESKINDILFITLCQTSTVYLNVRVVTYCKNQIPEGKMAPIHFNSNQQDVKKVFKKFASTLCSSPHMRICVSSAGHAHMVPLGHQT